MHHLTLEKLIRRLVSVAIASVVGSVSLALAGAQAGAEDAIKIGLSAPLTGPFAENGKQMIAAAKLFMGQNGTTIVGHRIELIIRDDGGVPDQARRIAQEFVVNDKAAVLAGYNPTPNALAVAPIATEARIPEIVVGAVASIITARSPYIRAQYHVCADPGHPSRWPGWAAKERHQAGRHHCVRLFLPVWMPRTPSLTNSRPTAEKSWRRCGYRCKTQTMPLTYSGPATPSQMRCFVWVPGGLAAALMRQYAERASKSVRYQADRRRRISRTTPC